MAEKKRPVVSMRVKHTHTHTWEATGLLVCVFPVESLVVFSTVSHSVAARTSLVPRATAHPAKLDSGG